ncbi:High mobility group protein 20A [Pseudolycoriella hygida]|uniref:High mobility group protein 20A n=1 Tax=Pseudolycoriella hygida TaxID=35572 RepID=A0A9Q0RVS1_9DIPT|nr:High mobility group protein 20A [Pseudolycoriella hygida]
MENNENHESESKRRRKMPKLKIKRYRRKVGEKKVKKDPNMPKHPLTGYVRYMIDRRPELKQLKPKSAAHELTKIIAEEWNTLTDKRKKPYLDAAELDKERYHREYAVYEANKAAESTTNNDTNEAMPQLEPIEDLEKRILNTEVQISQMKKEISDLSNTNKLLVTCNTQIREKLATALCGFSIPSESKPCNLENIDTYMTWLHQMGTSSHGTDSISEIREILRTLDFKINL